MARIVKTAEQKEAEKEAKKAANLGSEDGSEVNWTTCAIDKVLAQIQTPGVEIVKFEKGGKAEAQARFYASEPKLPFFYPVRDKEVPGSDKEWCIINGLRLLVTKGVYVQLPKSVAEHLMECLNQTALASSGVNVIGEDGKLKSARLDLQSESDQRALN